MEIIEKGDSDSLRVLVIHGWGFKDNKSGETRLVSPDYFSAIDAYQAVGGLIQDLAAVCENRGDFEEAKNLRYELSELRDAEMFHLAAFSEISVAGASIEFRDDGASCHLYGKDWIEEKTYLRSVAVSACGPGDHKWMSDVDRRSFIGNLSKLGVRNEAGSDDLEFINRPEVQVFFEEARRRVRDWEEVNGIHLNGHYQNQEPQLRVGMTRELLFGSRDKPVMEGLLSRPLKNSGRSANEFPDSWPLISSKKIIK